MNDKKISSIISLCSRAGKLVSGETACEEALKQNEARLIIISRDASDNTFKKFNNKAFYYNTKLVRYGLKEELGKLTGRTLKSVVAITDEGFAQMLTEQMSELF